MKGIRGIYGVGDTVRRDAMSGWRPGPCGLWRSLGFEGAPGDRKKTLP